MLFSLKKEEKEGYADTCYHTDEPWRHNIKQNKLDTKEQALCDSMYMKYLR